LILVGLTKAVQSCAIHGYTQLELSSLVTSLKDRHVLCIDYEGFDNKIPTFVLLSVGHLCITVCCFNPYETLLFTLCLCYLVTMPVFHPELIYKPRYKGLSSGTGLTSIFGSLCNVYMLSIAIRRYCFQHNIPLSKVDYICIVSSDDTIISSSFYIDFDKLGIILEDSFGMKIKLESYAKPGIDLAFFLGSK
jgi:hypothetical protein